MGAKLGTQVEFLGHVPSSVFSTHLRSLLHTAERISNSPLFSPLGGQLDKIVIDFLLDHQPKQIAILCIQGSLSIQVLICNIIMTLLMSDHFIIQIILGRDHLHVLYLQQKCLQSIVLPRSSAAALPLVEKESKVSHLHCMTEISILRGWMLHLFNPFLPTGQFLAPKLIIWIKCLIDILFFKVLF